MQDDWSPGAHDAFRGFRLRPALDLLSAVPEGLADGAVVDLGCGSGAAARALRARFPTRRLLGVDTSPAMLEAARRVGACDGLIEADAGGWDPEAPAVLLFSNACLHWLPDHAGLMPRLAASKLAEARTGAVRRRLRRRPGRGLSGRGGRTCALPFRRLFFVLAV